MTQNPSTTAIDEAQALYDASDWDSLADLAETYIADANSRANGYYWLARANYKKEDLAAAYDCIRKANDIAPTDVRIVAYHLEILFFCRATRKALKLLQDIPRDMLKNPRIQENEYWIYQRAGWNAKARQLWLAIDADSEYRPHMSTRELFTLHFLAKSLDHYLLKQEEVNRELTVVTFPGMRILESQSFASTEHLLQAHSDADSALLTSYARADRSDLRQKAIRILFGFLFLLTITLGSILTRGQMSLWIAWPMAAGISAAAFAASAALYESAETYIGGSIAASLAGGGAFAAGVGILQFTHDSKYWKWVALSLLAGGVYSAIAGVINFTLLAISIRSTNRHFNTHARGWCLNVIATLINDSQSMKFRADSAHRLSWIRALENTASIVEENLAKEVSLYDDATEKWLNERLHGVAEEFRHLKRSIVAPSGRSWDHLNRRLSRQMQAFAAEAWMSAGHRPPPPPRRRTKKDRALALAKFALTGTVPGLLYLAIAPLLGVEKNLLLRALMLSAAFGLLSLLIVLDPSLKEKADMAKAMLGGLGPLLSKGDSRPANEGRTKPPE